MERTSKDCPKLEVVSRSDVKTRREDRPPLDHGFFNSCNAGLREVPTRAWGRLPVSALPLRGTQAPG